MVVFDEYHAYENYKSITVFRTGFGKKPHPRSIIATTDGDVRGGPLDDQKEIWMEILKQEAEDNGTLPFMCRLDSESEVDDPDNWVKANPSIIYLPDLFDEIKKEYRDYKRNPAQNTAFIVKRMNLPVEAEEHQITAWENILATRQQVPDLKGKSCVCGIDYASTSDMVGVFLLFKEDGRYYGIHHAWWCTHSVDRNRVKFDLARGVKEGTLTIVDDKEINPELVTGWIHDKSADYEIEYVAIDKYRMTIMKKYLDEIGFSEMDGNLKIVRPSDIMLVQPVIDRIFNNQLLAVGEDALFRWFCWNTKVVPAPNGNAKYEKIEKRARKNDGFMAFVAGMTCEEYIIDRSDMTIPDVIIL
jgi:phage terminase large subunit-like protein